MIAVSSRRRSPLAVLACGLPGTALAQSAAGGTVKSQHGAWAVVCETPPGAPGEQCALIQTVVSEQRPEIGLVVIVLKTADKKATILRVQTPLGVVLPTQIQVAIDGRYSGNLQFMRCFADGCFAEAILDKPDTINGEQTTLQAALAKAGDGRLLASSRPSRRASASRST